MPARLAVHDVDPRLVIQEALGDLSWFDLRQNQILVAVYKRPSLTKSGIHLPDQTVDEDRWQGKVGLVMKMGPLAFVSDAKTTFHATDKLKIGDWVVYRASDGWQITLTESKQLCRIFVESDIRAVIPAPDLVW